jgi:GNAT superfamily N-acetyltransferase
LADIEFELVQSEQQKQQAGALIREYLEWLNERLGREYDLAFDVDAMLQSDLSDPDKFHPPYGRFYLVRYNGQIAGMGCLKRLDPQVGEVQRMYVSPAFRGKGIGRAIIDRLVADAGAMGYRQLRLESLNFLAEAHSLYHSVGFKDIAPYADNSMENYQSTDQLDQYYSIAVFMQMDLQA